MLPAHERLDAGDRAGRAGRRSAGSASTSSSRSSARRSSLSSCQRARPRAAHAASNSSKRPRPRPWRGTSRCRRRAAAPRRRAPLAGGDGDADARGDVELAAVDRERRRRARRASARDRARPPGSPSTSSQRTRELVAAEPRDRVGAAQQRRQAAAPSAPAARRRRAWPSVSLTSLKRSRSRSSDRERRARRGAAARSAWLEAVGEQRAVGQPGERVVQRRVACLLLGGATRLRGGEQVPGGLDELQPVLAHAASSRPTPRPAAARRPIGAISALRAPRASHWTGSSRASSAGRRVREHRRSRRSPAPRPATARPLRASTQAASASSASATSGRAAAGAASPVGGLDARLRERRQRARQRTWRASRASSRRVAVTSTIWHSAHCGSSPCAVARARARPRTAPAAGWGSTRCSILTTSASPARSLRIASSPSARSSGCTKSLGLTCRRSASTVVAEQRGQAEVDGEQRRPLAPNEGEDSLRHTRRGRAEQRERVRGGVEGRREALVRQIQRARRARLGLQALVQLPRQPLAVQPADQRARQRA